MSKTAEEMAKEYGDYFMPGEDNKAYTSLIKEIAFLAGYQAAMKTPEEMAEEYIRYDNESAYWTKHAFLAGYKAAKEQLADADKVITYDYVETASNEARELITKFELKNDEDVLVKALVAAYCRGVDAVDGYLRNSLSAYRNSVRRQQWISVKDRLPKEGMEVVIGWFQQTASNKLYWTTDVAILTNKVFSGWRVYSEVTHWMELPAPPKEGK